jgi:hypothetical protein
MICNVTLRAEYIPSPPSDFIATAYNRTQINLTWTNAGTNNTYIEWNTAEHWAIGAGTEIYNSTGTSYEHTGRSPSTPYYYQAWSWNETDSTYSLTNSSGNDTTLANTLPAFSGFTVVNESTVGSMSIFWNVTIIDVDGDTFDWTIECNNSDSDGANGASSGAKSLQLTGLDYSSSYKVWVNATDQYGTNSSWYTFTTRPEYVPDKPNDFNANAYNRTQINLTWSKGNEADNTYIVAKLGSDPTNRTGGTNIYNNTGTSYSHTSLSPSQHWYYRAWSWNATDKTWSSTYSSANTSTLKNNPPSFGTPTPANGSTNLSLSLTWQISLADANGDTFNWTVQCSNGQQSSANGASNGTKSLSISSLTYSTNYTVWVNSTDSQNWTRKWYTFTTRSQYVPNAPIGFTATAASSNQINLAWTKGTNANHTRIQRKTGSYPLNISDGTNIYNSTGTSYSNIGLTAGTTYYYRTWSWNTTDKLWSTNNASANSTTNSGGSTPPYTPPYTPPPSGEEPTITEEVEDLYDITLNEDFYANDTNGDGIADTFTDPNGILHDEHAANINGNASFLISVDGDVDKLFIWDTEADTITPVNHSTGDIIDTEVNADVKTIIITVSSEKVNWTYMEINDQYPDNPDLIVKTADGRTILSDMMWRENDTIYILDDPATEYLLIYSYKEEGFLFDVLLELTPDSVYAGQNITALVTMINVGEPGMVNGTLNYTIYKGEEIVWSELENVSVLGQKAINKTISTKGLGVGEYTCEVVYAYGDNTTASARASFTITPIPQQLISPTLPPIVPIILAVAAISAFVAFLIWFLKKRRHAE